MSQSTTRLRPDDTAGLRATSFQWDDHHRLVKNRRRLIPAWEQRAAYDLLDISPGERAIDLGCGVGHWTRILAFWGLNTTGYDFSDVALTHARAADVEGRAKYMDWDIDREGTPTDIEPGSVDLVTCRLSLEYLDRTPLLDEVRRWLAPGRGRFYALIRVSPDEETHGRDPFLRRLTREQIDEIGSGWADREEFRQRGLVGLVLRAPAD